MNSLDYYSVLDLDRQYLWVGNASSVTGGQVVVVSKLDVVVSSDACFACAPVLYCSFGLGHRVKAECFVVYVS